MSGNMRRIVVFLLLVGCISVPANAQELALKKGIVMDSLPVNDSIVRQIMLYLPQDFDTGRQWPVLFLCDVEGERSKKLRYLKAAADKNGYIIASSRALQDSLSLTDKVLTISKSFDQLKDLLPLDLDRVYTLGYDTGGQLATIVPSMLRGVNGVLSVASSLSNLDLINPKEPFDYVGIMGQGDYQYTYLLESEVSLDQRKVPNYTLYHPEGHQWPDLAYLDLGMQMLTLMGMKRAAIPRDDQVIQSAYTDYQKVILELEQKGNWILAYHYAEQGESVFKALADTDWFKDKKKSIRKSKLYKNQKRDWDAVRLKELVLAGDYLFYLEEDVLSFNLDNLGWWNYQMGKIAKYKESAKREEQLLGERLDGYLNALVEEYLEMSGQEPNPDYDGLILLNMLKTITAPGDYDHYLQVISLTAKYNDFGTSNYYLEALLEKGYTDAENLYNLPHTGLLRISPEYNALIAQYLGEARYAIE
jgi:hypothetical protein